MMKLTLPNGTKCCVPAMDGLYFAASDPTSPPAYFECDLEASPARGYVMSLGKAFSNTHTGDLDLAVLLHHRLGHYSWQNKHLADRLRATFGKRLGVNHKQASCDSCVRSKLDQSFSRTPSTRPATRPLERVHLDFVPQIPTKGRNGATGFVLLVDEFTGMYFPELIHSKSELPGILQSFKARAEHYFRECMGTARSSGQSSWPRSAATGRPSCFPMS